LGKKYYLFASFFVLILISSLCLLFQTFEFSPNEGRVDYVIKSDGSVDPADQAIVRDGELYRLQRNIVGGSIRVEKSSVVIDGYNYHVGGNNDHDGVLLVDVQNVTLQNLTIVGAANGIQLLRSTYCRILSSSMINNAFDGVKLNQSSYNMVCWSNLTQNEDDGVSIVSDHSVFPSVENRVMANNIVGNRDNGGFLWGFASQNLFAGNIFTNNQVGLSIDEKLNNNSVYQNNISNNSIGVYLSSKAQENTFRLNNFYDEIVNEYVQGNFSSNVFEGNYWGIQDCSIDSAPLDAPIDIRLDPEFWMVPYDAVKSPSFFPPWFWSLVGLGAVSLLLWFILYIVKLKKRSS
jgi:nitrous oxidase accessory protein NosD